MLLTLSISDVVFMSRYWLRCLRRNLAGPSRWPALLAQGAIAGAKAGLDCAAVVSGLRHRLLRHRATPLTAREIHAWQEVWKSHQAPVEGHGYEARAPIGAGLPVSTG